MKLNIETAFKWHWDIPTEKFDCMRRSWVFLSSEIEWNYQKEAKSKMHSTTYWNYRNNISIISLSKDTNKRH
jgi:hypothetical protein